MHACTVWAQGVHVIRKIFSFLTATFILFICFLIKRHRKLFFYFTFYVQIAATGRQRKKNVHEHYRLAGLPGGPRS